MVDLHPLEIDGTAYAFRTPTLYDTARLERTLTLQRVRRPSLNEFRVAALAGVAALAEAVGNLEEGERQAEAIEAWYPTLTPTDEDEIDEPDLEARGLELLRLETERAAEQRRLYPLVTAIEANLERHWPAYAELVADRKYWDAVSRIEIVRLLLVRASGAELARDGDNLLSAAAYKALTRRHRAQLATFAFGLLAPSETQRKN